MTALMLALTILPGTYPSEAPLTQQQQTDLMTGFVDPRVVNQAKDDHAVSLLVQVFVVLSVLVIAVALVRKVRWSRLSTRYVWEPAYQRFSGTNTYALDGMELGNTLKAMAVVTLKPDGHPTNMIINGKLNLTVVESIHVTKAHRFHRPRMWWW